MGDANAVIGTINRVIGDWSFAVAHRRLPAATDEPDLRVRTHLAFVEGLLRRRDSSSPSRATMLDHLRHYRLTGQFPLGEASRGHLPVFTDRRGVRCAVAHLIEQTAGSRLADAIDRECHNTYLDAGLGGADEGSVAYDVHARAGSWVVFYPGHDGHGHLIGLLGGIGIDGVGDPIPAAWTAPVDAFYYVNPAAPIRVGLIGGPRFTVAGDRPLGWSAGVHVVWREALTPGQDSDEGTPFGPRDLHFEVDAEGLAGAVFLGLSVGVGTRARYGYWSR